MNILKLSILLVMPLFIFTSNAKATQCESMGCYCDQSDIPPACFSEPNRCCPDAPRKPRNTAKDDFSAIGNAVATNRAYDYLNCFGTVSKYYGSDYDAGYFRLSNTESGINGSPDLSNAGVGVIAAGAFPPPNGQMKRLYIVTRSGIHQYDYQELYDLRRKKIKAMSDHQCTGAVDCEHVLVIPPGVSGDKKRICIELSPHGLSDRIFMKQVACNSGGVADHGVTLPNGDFLTDASKKLFTERAKLLFPKIESKRTAAENSASGARVAEAVTACRNVPELRSFVAKRLAEMPKKSSYYPASTPASGAAPATHVD